MKFGGLGYGFFIHENQIYFIKKRGKWPFYYPVLDDRISRSPGNTCLQPYIRVEVIPRQDWDKHGLTDEMVEKFLAS